MTKELINLEQTNKSTQTALIDQTREIAQVKAQYFVAKEFPRDENISFQRVIKQCQRKSMAEVAMYSYPRGGSNVTGPSIRLAELLANSYGNLEFGTRVLGQDNEKVQVAAYCVDLETNTRKVDYFEIRLEKFTKKDGIKKLSDPRDIYEHISSQASRRVRGCVLAIIPGDIVEAAIEQCEKTLNSDEEPIHVRIDNLIKAFTTYNVTVQMIEKRMGKNIQALNNTDIVSLRKIYQSLKDGMAGIEDYFDINGRSKSSDIANFKMDAEKPSEVKEGIE